VIGPIRSPAEIAYTDPKGGPAAFCVIRNGEKTSPLRIEARDGFSYTIWAKDGKGYTLIARISVDRFAD
jgi:hypothetical protein